MWAPLFAQLLTLSVGDRTEVRYLEQPPDSRFEGTTTPVVQLSLNGRQAAASLAYAPSLTLTPLEKKPRETLILHQLSLQTGYQLRRTSFGLGSTLTWGEVNLRSAALQGLGRTNVPGGQAPDDGQTPDGGQTPDTGQLPDTGQAPGAGDPTTPPQAEQPDIVDRTVNNVSSTTAATVSHQFSRELTGDVFAGYSVAGSFGKDSDEVYPLTHGWTVGTSATYTILASARDTWDTEASVQEFVSSNDNEMTVGLLSEKWTHAVSRRTYTYVAGGLSMSRQITPTIDAYGTYPTALLGIDYQRPVARGELRLSSSVSSAPYFDPVRATLDPRLGAQCGAGWTRDRFSAAVALGTSISVAVSGADQGAVDSYDASASMSYAPFDAVAFDAGWRGTARSFRDVVTVPPSWAAYLAVSVGYSVLLNGRR